MNYNNRSSKNTEHKLPYDNANNESNPMLLDSSQSRSPGQNRNSNDTVQSLERRPPNSGPGPGPRPPSPGPGPGPRPPSPGPGPGPRPPSPGPGPGPRPPSPGPGPGPRPPSPGPGPGPRPPFPGPGPGPRPPSPGPGPGPMPPFPPAPGQNEPAPMIAPPNFIPQSPNRHSGSRGIRLCFRRNTYIWMNNGDNFWFYPTTILGNNIFGFRWWGFGWIFFRVEANRIRHFQCF